MRTLPNSELADSALLRALAMRSATSPVSSPTTTNDSAVAMSDCLAMVNLS